MASNATRKSHSLPDSEWLLKKQYGCGPVQFAGTSDALYERHLLFDNGVDPAAATARDRFEALARSVRDILSQRWLLTEKTYEQRNPKRFNGRQHSGEMISLSRHNPLLGIRPMGGRRIAMFFIVNPEKAKPGQNLQAGMAIRVHTTDLNSYWFDHGPPLFINSTCAGPVGHDVQVAKKWLTVRPGFTQITMENDGRVIGVQELYADWTM